jgi:hypothetical protein
MLITQLNDVPSGSGGGTTFNNVGTTALPIKGSAVMW